MLRARTPTGIEQEVYALLVTYQLLRTAMADATTDHEQPELILCLLDVSSPITIDS